jgi:REP element-mobilizing transposase RayT
MVLSSEIRHGRHCVCQLHVHLVFVTKVRYRIFDGNAIERLSALLNSLKGVSSRLLRLERPDLLRRYSERRPLVALLLCRQLRRGTYRCSEAAHRAAKDTALGSKRCLISSP